MFWKHFRKMSLPSMLFTGIMMKLIDVFIYKNYKFGFYHLLYELMMWILAALVLSFILVYIDKRSLVLFENKEKDDKKNKN